jgi:DNA-binding IclR family transcriptional regulator
VTSTSEQNSFAARTLRAVELVSFGARSVAQLTADMGVHPRTVRRLLARLVEEGYLTRGADGRSYEPTMRLVALAAQIVEHHPLTRQAAPLVFELHVRTGLDAHLMIPSYRETVCVVHASGGRRAQTHPRELLPCHATAAGQVLLAGRDAWRHATLSRPLARLTGQTLTDPAELGARLTEVNTHGFCVEDGQCRDGFGSVAAPVRDRTDSEVLAALALSGPSATIREHRAELVDHVTDLATRLSAMLG